MQNLKPHFKAIITRTNLNCWKWLAGWINHKMIEENIPDNADRNFYTGGPKLMVDAMRSILSEIGLAKAQINYECFIGISIAIKLRQKKIALWTSRVHLCNTRQES
jgi:ferredoxin-NADP reductase